MRHSAPSDTIAAIATAPGEGAVSIVRVSGPDTYAWTDRLFACTPPLPSSRPAGTFVHGQVRHPETHEMIDEALLLLFHAPHSYTGEDSVEFQCHGGTQVAQRVLRALICLGARPAEPGEFTKRAFLNGKLNLTQAEAVLDLVHARSERAARLASAQLQDVLGQHIHDIYEAILKTTADVESMLDFPDDELPQSVTEVVLRNLSEISTDIQSLLNTWQEGRVLRDGARIVIAGAPNVGKSTLLNRLAGRDRAIVSPHPGTTRDTIEESIVLQGYPIYLMDTAGLRDAPCEIEQEGIRRTHHALSKADLCICILDASVPPSENEFSFLNSHSPDRTMVLLNKTDLGSGFLPSIFSSFEPISVSLKKDSDLHPITERILQLIIRNPGGSDHENLMISDRHNSILQIVHQDVMESVNLLSTRNESDYLPAANRLQSALERLGLLWGKDCTEEMLDHIFSRFCVGK